MIDTIATALQKHLTSAVVNELALHRGIKLMISGGMLPPALHECRLGASLDRPRIDFYFDGYRIGLEVKVAGTAGQIVRQLYTYEPFVDGLILLTTRRLAIDQDLFEKPFRQVVLFHR